MRATKTQRPNAAEGKSGSKRAARLGSVLQIVAINVLVLLVLGEAALRIQEAIGPFADLDILLDGIMAALSDGLNHVHPPGADWDGNGLRHMNEPSAPSCGAKILFMGD